MTLIERTGVNEYKVYKELSYALGRELLINAIMLSRDSIEVDNRMINEPKFFRTLKRLANDSGRIMIRRSGTMYLEIRK